MAAFNTMAQTNEERQERADKLFEKGQYVEATKDYLHLLSLNQRIMISISNTGHVFCIIQIAKVKRSGI
jgi:hypothetical protein